MLDFRLEVSRSVKICVHYGKTLHFLFFLIIDLYFLIPAVFAQIFNKNAKLVIPTEITTNETNVKIETQPLQQK